MRMARNKLSSRNEESALEEALNELVDLVDKEVKVFQELHGALIDQYKSVLEEDVDEVWNNVSKVRELVEQTKILEHDRKKRTSQVSSQLGADNPEPTLSELIPLVEVRYAKRLNELKDLLLTLSERIKTTNLRNKNLLNRSLRMVNKKIKLLTGGVNSNALYTEGGKEKIVPREYFSVKS